MGWEYAAVIVLPDGTRYDGLVIRERKTIDLFEEKAMRLAAHWPNDKEWIEFLRANGLEPEEPHR